MGSLRTAISFTGILLLNMCLFSIFPQLAFSAEVETTIDISYLLIRENDAEQISTSRTLEQIYKLEYATSLNYFYDFTGKIGFKYRVQKKPDAPSQKIMEPTLNLSLASDTLQANFDYIGTRDFTGSSPTQSETTTFVNSYLFEAVLNKSRLPETTLRLERNTDFQSQLTETISEGLGLDLKYALSDLAVGWKYSQKKDRKILGDTSTSDNVKWESTVSYGRSFSNILDLQVDYSITEDITNDFGKRNVFKSYTKDYGQGVDTSLKNSFTVFNDIKLAFSYDYKLEQDFMEEDFESKMSHKISGSLEKDLLSWSKMNLKYEGSNEKQLGAGREEDEQKIDGKFSGLLSIKPFSWLQMEGKAEREWGTLIEGLTGRTVDTTKINRYEIDAQSEFSKLLKLSAVQGIEEEFENDLLLRESIKYKFKGTCTPLASIRIEPSFEIDLEKEYDLTYLLSLLDSTDRAWNAKLSVSFKKKWLDIFGLNTSYSLSYKKEQELDGLSNLTEKTSLSEDSSLSVQIDNLIRGLSMEAEVTHKVSDELDDEEPMIIDRALMANIEWEIRELSISYKYQFDDKGDADNTLSVGVKVAWTRDLFEISGEYKHDEIFSEETDKQDQYDIRLHLIF